MRWLKKLLCNLIGHRNPPRFVPNDRGLYDARCERCGAIIELDRLQDWYG